MDSLFSILSQKNYDEPPESASIKKYIQETLQSPAGVTIRERDIVVTVASGALASALRLKLPEMQRRCQLTKRVIIKVGR